MGKMSRLGNALYEGDVSIDFVGRKWLWYGVSTVILAVAVAGLLVKGLNFGIEFEGGVEYAVSLPADQVTQDNADKIRTAVAGTGIDAASSPIVNTSGTDSIRVQTEELTNDQAAEVADVIAETVGVDAKNDISTQEVGASWGAQVAERALLGLGVFMVLVVLFIWAYFREWKMSVGAIVALIHDVVITIGVYALSGFEVTPATVTGILTILGFSLYDTVVVFDKVRENTRHLRQSKQTYAQLANLAVNQTLVRSINTSIVALLPVGAILYVGVATLGTGALKDLSLSLFVGMAAGAYSSIFIATPLVVHLKSHEKAITEQDARAKARARRSVDRYADVPVFADDLPVRDRAGDVDPDERRSRRSGTPASRCRHHRVGPRPPGPAASYPGRRRHWVSPEPRSAPSPSGSRGPSAASDRHDRRRGWPERADRGADPRHPRLPQARGHLQGHHSAARRPRDVHRRRGGARCRRSRRERRCRRGQGRRHGGARVHPRGSGGPGARGRLRAGAQARQAALAHARSQLRAGVRRGDARDAHRRARPGRAGAGHRRRARHRGHRPRHRRAGRAGRRGASTVSRCCSS